MYPRQESVLFGGSYLEGDVVDGEWEGESQSRPLTVDGVTIPERLYTVTEDIVGEYVDISPELVDAKYRYRPYRGDGMRIERSGDIVHNYGHGGAGVSMSWRSVLQAVDCIDDVSEDVPAGAYVTVKETKPGYKYYYWQWRDGDSWKNEYIGPVED